MKYLSLFSGIGGFELGIKQAYDSLSKTEREQPRGDKKDKSMHGKSRLAPECIGFSEIDKYAVSIYEKHFPEHKNYGDITKIDEKTLPDFDILMGGFPCQSFSIAGKRGGFADTRGTLFFEIARILKYKQPRLLLLENVKGLLSHDKGDTLKVIITTLDELGYDLQWQVLNSKNFGVPQNRERVFIVGHLRGTPRPEVFPFGESDRLPAESIGEEKVESGISSAITSNYKRGVHSGGETYAIGTYRTHKDGNGFRELKQGISPTIPARAREDGSGEPVLKEGTRIRRLTPKECERLQGFPDNWTEGVSDTQRYKCLGNAVTVNVVKEILSKLIK